MRIILVMGVNVVWQRKTLPNGLTVLEYPRKFANTAQLALAVKYGSNREPKQASGIAHFLEHMLAGGSEKRIKLSRSIENHGGILDLYTDRDHVLAMIDVLPGKLVESCQILFDLFFSNEFEEDKFRLELKIILNELAEVEDDPAAKVEELLLKNLFKKHPIRRPVGGYPKTVKRFSINQLKRVQLENYVAPNVALVFSGNLSSTSLDQALTNFKNLPSRNKTIKNEKAIEKTRPQSYVTAEKAGLNQTYLSIGARTSCSAHKDSPAMDLVSTLLTGGTSSRLFIELREKNAVTYDVCSAQCKGTDFGYFSINCAVKNSKAEKARNIILKELANFRNREVGNEELDRAKQIWFGSLLRGMDSIHDTLEIITYMEIQFKSEFALRDYIEKIKALTKENIREAALKYLNEDRLCTASISPKKQ